MREPYAVLGLPSDAPEDTLKSRYEELRTRYSEERFLDGEAGNEAARKLMELEDAWILISSDLQRKSYKEEFGGDYGAIDNLIKGGKYDEAQRLMDSVTVRTAEWHYYQSIIYYKREWLTESRKQLVMAVSMEPQNTKYSEALTRLDTVKGNSNTQQQTMGAGPQRQQSDMGNALCRCCQTYICLECLCSLCCR